jgi:hypothetical protein
MTTIPTPMVFCGFCTFLPADANNSNPIKAKKHELKHFTKLSKENFE